VKAPKIRNELVKRSVECGGKKVSMLDAGVVAKGRC
jgi:hypothetical protein